MTRGRCAALVALALAAAGCGGRTTFLGAKLPSTCKDSSSASRAGERCVGWIFDRLAVVARDDEYESPALRVYVTAVAERIARANHLPVPTVRVVDRGTARAFAQPGGYVYVSRDLLSIFDNEAELAGVIAHEMAHQAAGHTADLLDAFPDPYPDYGLRDARSRDDEAVADEMAVGYIATAGYAPDAMRTALVALDRANADIRRQVVEDIMTGVVDGLKRDGMWPLPEEIDATTGAAAYEAPPREVLLDDRHLFPHEIDDSDPTHPAMAERIARVTRVIAGRTGGELAAARFRDHAAGVIVGDDPRRGVLVGATWSAARLGLAVDLPDGYQLDGDEGRLDAAAKKHEASLWAIGAPWADAVAATLSDRRRLRVAGHPAVTGMARPRPEGARRSDLEIAMDTPRPDPGSAVAVIDAGGRALAIYVSGAEPERQLRVVLGRIRPIRPAERAAAVPARLAFHRAPVAGTVAELVARLCAMPDASRGLDNPARRVAAGDPVKCVEK